MFEIEWEIDKIFGKQFYKFKLDKLILVQIVLCYLLLWDESLINEIYLYGGVIFVIRILREKKKKIL